MQSVDLACEYATGMGFVDGDCESCSLTRSFAVVCERAQAHFNRVADCLLPHIAGINRLATDSLNSTEGSTCIVLSAQGSERLLADMVDTLLGARPRALLFVRASPSTSTKCNVIARQVASLTSHQNATMRLVPRSPHPRDAWRVVHAGIEGLLRRAHPPQRATPYILLIARRQNRIFINEGQIITRLQSLTACHVLVYTGSETQTETMALFGGADAIVGYHGAGLINAVFAPNPICVVELSTYSSTGHGWSRQAAERCNTSMRFPVGSSEPTLARVITWRSNRDDVRRWNPKLDWRTHRLQLQQLLDANHWPCAALLPMHTRTRDLQIKVLRFVGLSNADVDNVANHLIPCLQQRALQRQQQQRLLRRDPAGVDGAALPNNVPPLSPPPPAATYPVPGTCCGLHSYFSAVEE